MRANIRTFLGKLFSTVDRDPMALDSYIASKDAAEAAMKILLNPTPHRNVSYSLVSQITSPAAALAEYNAETGKHITCMRLPYEVLAADMKAWLVATGGYDSELVDNSMAYIQADLRVAQLALSNYHVKWN
jgi:hypothetical protein